jgi:hypothetical protein
MISFIGGGLFNAAWCRGSILSSLFCGSQVARTSFSEAVVDATFSDCQVCEGAFEYVIKLESSIDISFSGTDKNGDPEVVHDHDPLTSFRVNAKPTLRQLELLDDLLRLETDENVFQKFLEQNPELIAALLVRGHHGMYVLPQVAFGNKHRADFMIAAKNSMGHFWTGLEIESPRHDVVNRDGHFSAQTQHAIDQVRDWKTYVRQNRASVQQPKSLGGEGLIGIEHEFDVWVIIGRNRRDRDNDADRRAKYLESRIHVQTWDGFRDRIEAAIRELGERR